MMRYQAAADIEALRKLKERAEEEEERGNSLVRLADAMLRDAFDARLQTGETHPQLNVLHDNSTDLKKELKFLPITYNCGKTFDIYKLLEQAKGANRHQATQCPKCVEEILLDGSTQTTVTCKTTDQNTSRTTNQSTARSTVSTSSPSSTVGSTATTARLKLFKSLDPGKKVPEAVINTSAEKVQKQQETQGLKSPLSSQGLQNQKAPQQVAETIKVNVPLSAIQSTLQPVITNKPLVLTKNINLAMPTGANPVDKSGKQPQPQLQEQDSSLYTPDEPQLFKNPNDFPSDQKSFYDDEEPLKIDHDKMPEIEYVYSD